MGAHRFLTATVQLDDARLDDDTTGIRRRRPDQAYRRPAARPRT
jgi:hypothetical protein